MALYSYVAYDKSGARVQGSIPAASRSLALEALSRKGQFPLSLDEARDAPLRWWDRDIGGSGRLAVGHLAILTRELASLLTAGIPVDESFRLIALQPQLPRRVQAVVRDLRKQVGEGQSLSRSIAAQGSAFPEFYWRLIEAGEATGSLDATVNDLATYLETSEAMRGRVASALVYPAILLVAASFAIGVVLAVLLPALAPLFEEARVAPPAIISAMAGIETFVRGNWLALSVLVATLTAAGIAVRTSPSGRAVIDAAVLSVPVIGPLIERRETGRLSRTLAMLLKNGVSVVDATRIASAVVTNRAMGEAVERASQDVREGGTLSIALARSQRFSELFMRMVAVGERTGQVDDMLFRAANIYESALTRQLQRVIGLITPVATLAIGGVVGVLMLSVMSALMSINDLALR